MSLAPRSFLPFLLLALTVATWSQGWAGFPQRVLKVGPGLPLSKPSQAANLAKNGDVIEIAPGEYRGDAAVWRAHNLTLRGAPGGMAVLKAAGASAEGKAIWVIRGDNATVENIAFQDAAVRDKNGAGIRLEGRNLTVRRCLFRDNENGILTGANKDSDVLIENSEFDHNGHGDGYSHNLYIGAIRKLTLRASYSHGARIGHQIKSRAAENHILYNRLMDEAAGHSSYLIDLPEAGLAYVVGNLLHQGPQAENATMISFGAERQPPANNRLYFLHNTLVNERHGECKMLSVHPKAGRAVVLNNLIVGCQRMDGPILDKGNVQARFSDLLAPANYDYRPIPSRGGVDLGLSCATLEQLGLNCPDVQYRHPMMTEPRSVQGMGPDVGAYEASR